MKQQGLCHPKCSECLQNKQSDWSDFRGWSKQAIWLVQLHSLWRGFEKYFRLRVTKVPFLKSCLWLISSISGVNPQKRKRHRTCSLTATVGNKGCRSQIWVELKKRAHSLSNWIRSQFFLVRSIVIFLPPLPFRVQFIEGHCAAMPIHNAMQMIPTGHSEQI